MDGLTFTRDEVEAAARVAPWRLQREFSAEINPEDMGETARVYQRAAGEASTTQDLAEAATEIAEESGGQDGRTVVDGADRDARTATELSDGGEEMEQVSRYLTQAMEVATNTEREVRSMIENYLDPRLAEHLAAAQAEYVNRTNGHYYVGGERVTVEYTDESRPNDPQLASEIRGKYLRMAADDAEYAHGSISRDIEDYRGLLTRYGKDLDDLGYDLTAGPLDLWTSPQMARYAADSLKEALALGGDPARLEFYTRTLFSMVKDVLENVATAGPRQLSDAEGRYLDEFLATLGPDGLAALGNVVEEHGEGALQVGRAHAAVGNGVMMMLNHDIRVPDPDAPRIQDAHRAISPYLSQLEGPLFENDPDSDAFREGLEKYNGFGNLVERSSVPADDGNSRRLAFSALDVQERTSQQYEPDEFLWFDFEPDNVVENTGSAKMLASAGENRATAMDLLKDPNFTQQMFDRQWENSSGVARFIEQGIYAEDSSLENRVLSQPTVDNVLAAADEAGDRVQGTGPQDEYGHVDHTALRDLLDSLRE
ncbi:hypothetical protein E1265_17375 [Streptomyces sp. 8K308]|uniref:hypothetical protein n=1 Tax=Streptomyces sp. 8K308 TaxID=2530388 RepID=UPI00104A7DC9|nr:hypothetical protein [Streptomyces sp. 8K308]TDC21699.1 hypothetical protein E1265_17375 [Streptomyces sp. 8K308]